MKWSEQGKHLWHVTPFSMTHHPITFSKEREKAVLVTANIYAYSKYFRIWGQKWKSRFPKNLLLNVLQNSQQKNTPSQVTSKRAWDLQKHYSVFSHLQYVVSEENCCLERTSETLGNNGDARWSRSDKGRLVFLVGRNTGATKIRYTHCTTLRYKEN